MSLTITNDQAKPLQSANGFGRPWNLPLLTALMTNSRSDYAAEVDGLERVVPSGCIGAIVGESDPIYLLYGMHFQRRVVFLPASDPNPVADRDGLAVVVVYDDLKGRVNGLVNTWSERRLGGHWLLLTRGLPPGTPTRCTT